ncbi:MAG: sigma-70 family RNA polymerase sigma factor [Actinomycetota bacterium]
MAIGLNFETVLYAARTGAEWAWTALYLDLAPAIHGYLRAHGAKEAEDLTQEVLVAIVRGLPDFEGDEAGFRSWAFVITHRRLLDARRSRGRHPVDPVPDARLETAGGDVEGEALDNLDTERVRTTLNKLPTDQRDVLLLRIVAGLTPTQIAPIIGKTPGAVKQIQRRGLEAVVRLVTEQRVTR